MQLFLPCYGWNWPQSTPIFTPDFTFSDFPTKMVTISLRSWQFFSHQVKHFGGVAATANGKAARKITCQITWVI